MKYEGRLTPAHPSAQLQLSFQPVALAVSNPTPYAVLVRRGIAALPTREDYDYIIPAGTNLTIATVGYEFALVLDALPGAAAGTLPVTFIFVRDEQIPVFSQMTYREALTVSDLSDPVTIDVRGARAIAFEIRYQPIVVVTSPFSVNMGKFAIYAHDNPDDFNPATSALVRVVNTLKRFNLSRAVIPISSNYLTIDWTPYETTVLDVRYTLLDAYPSVTPQYQAFEAVREFTAAQWPSESYLGIFTDAFVGRIDTLDVQLVVPLNAAFTTTYLVPTYFPPSPGSTYYLRMFEITRPSTTSLEGVLQTAFGPLPQYLEGYVNNPDTMTETFFYRLPIHASIQTGFSTTIYRSGSLTRAAIALKGEGIISV